MINSNTYSNRQYSPKTVDERLSWLELGYKKLKDEIQTIPVLRDEYTSIQTFEDESVFYNGDDILMDLSNFEVGNVVYFINSQVDGVVTQIRSTTANESGVEFSVSNTATRIGDTGNGISSITSGTPSEVGEYTRTPIEIAYTNNTTQMLGVLAKRGTKGERGQDGRGVVEIRTIGNIIPENMTSNQFRVEYTDNTMQDFTVYAKNGTGITNAVSGQDFQNAGYTVTPITFTKSDGTSNVVNVPAKNGADATSTIIKGTSNNIVPAIRVSDMINYSALPTPKRFEVILTCRIGDGIRLVSNDTETATEYLAFSSVIRFYIINSQIVGAFGIGYADGEIKKVTLTPPVLSVTETWVSPSSPASVGYYEII